MKLCIMKNSKISKIISKMIIVFVFGEKSKVFPFLRKTLYELDFK